jgi:hypothetical protein
VLNLTGDDDNEASISSILQQSVSLVRLDVQPANICQNGSGFPD